MGWNDRLFDDPYRPYQSEEDRDAYENWAAYLASLAAEAAADAGSLSSANLLPGDARGHNPPVELVDRLHEVLQNAEPWQINNDVPGTQGTDENNHSRESARDPEQHEERPA